MLYTGWSTGRTRLCAAEKQCVSEARDNGRGRVHDVCHFIAMTDAHTQREYCRTVEAGVEAHRSASSFVML